MHILISSRPWAVHKPHLRAKFGLILFHIFLPVNDRIDEELYTNNPSVDGPHTDLLNTHIDAQRYLSPTLLLLYGDVEKTGYYEKLINRRSIMIVLKHLWYVLLIDDIYNIYRFMRYTEQHILIFINNYLIYLYHYLIL